MDTPARSSSPGPVGSWPGRSRRRATLAGVVLGLAGALAACGDGGGASSPGAASSAPAASGTAPGTGTPATGTTPTTPTPTGTAPTAADFKAARFLQQATFGATKADIAHLEAVGVSGWLDEQVRMAPTLHLDRCQSFNQGQAYDFRPRNETFWERALTAPDQLRQRVAYALSHTFVVSDQSSALVNAQVGLCAYTDVLLRDGLGSYRQLLEDVTLSPAMGRYLSMLNNAKPDATGRRADENYARESMQLFTLGLYRLNADGTAVQDAAGQPLNTYTQADVENMARVFTGWSWGDAKAFGDGAGSFLVPMKAFPAQHDPDAKTIVGGVGVPAGGTPAADLKIALDTLFNHPNAGPFLATHLIQALVTSNPSPAYVGRVAAVFANDGVGARGNLAAVVRAILTDDEAVNGPAQLPDTFGRAREPILKVAQLWRAFNGQTASGTYAFWYGSSQIFQAPLGAPSVFDYYAPDFSPPGALRDAGILAPEMQMATSASVARWDNFLLGATGTDVKGGSAPAGDMLIDLSAETARAGGDMGAVLDDYNLLLLAGRMTPAMRQALLDDASASAATTAAEATARATETLYLVTASPQFAVQR